MPARPHSIWFPLAVVGAAAAVVWWLYHAGIALRAPYSLGVAGLAVVLLAFWYVVLLQRTWRGRGLALARVLLVGLVVGGSFFGMFRYAGSLDGTAMPRFVFRWADEERELRPLVLDADGETRPALPHEDSPQFLGPLRTGVFPDVRLATDWEANPPEEIWRRDVGGGWSGFAVQGRRAITQEQRGDFETVVCYDLATGTPLWAHKTRAHFKEPMGGDGPRATPTIAGGRVFAMGGTGILDCLDLVTGERLWSRDVLADTGGEIPQYGMAGSPLVEGDAVIVGGGDGGAGIPSLIAYRASDGGEIWRGGQHGCAYASPVILAIDGLRTIVSINGTEASGHAIDGGETLWTFPWSGHRPKCSQPVAIDADEILLSASYGMGAHRLRIADGGDESGSSATEIWSSQRLKTKFSSAVARGGFAYGLDEGTLACIDLATGDRVWKDGRYGLGQNLLVGDILLVQEESGEIVLVAADPMEFRELARMPALNGGKAWNMPTLAAPYLLVRNAVEAVCFRLPLADVN